MNFKDVAEFQAKILQRKQPVVPMLLVQGQEYVELLEEEMHELKAALQQRQLAETADALVDLVYVAMGFAWQMNMPWEKMWTAVHAANMRKHLGVTKRGHKVDAVKPQNWVDPVIEIRKLLHETNR